MNDFQNYTQQSTSFIGFIQNGIIYTSSGQKLGRTEEKYQELIDTAKGYENILYEKGILIKPKTPEEINKELQETLKQTQAMMAEMSSTILTLNEKVNKLEDKKDDFKQTSSSSKSIQVSGSRQNKSSESSL